MAQKMIHTATDRDAINALVEQMQNKRHEREIEICFDMVANFLNDVLSQISRECKEYGTFTQMPFKGIYNGLRIEGAAVAYSGEFCGFEQGRNAIVPFKVSYNTEDGIEEITDINELFSFAYYLREASECQGRYLGRALVELELRYNCEQRENSVRPRPVEEICRLLRRWGFFEWYY